MPLSYTEAVRLEELEAKVASLQELIKKSASTDMLNRLLTLCNEENRKTRETATELEEKLNELILLAQKLQ